MKWIEVFDIGLDNVEEDGFKHFTHWAKQDDGAEILRQEGQFIRDGDNDCLLPKSEEVGMVECGIENFC